MNQKWLHLMPELGANGDGEVGAKWLHDMDRRATTLMNQKRIDQKKKWVIDEDETTTAIPDFV